MRVGLDVVGAMVRVEARFGLGVVRTGVGY